MKRHKLIIIGWIIFIGIFFAFPVHAAKEIGKITLLDGTAEITRESARVPMKAYVGMPLHLRDKVKTMAESRLRIELIDGSILSLGENAELDLDKFEFEVSIRETTSIISEVVINRVLKEE